MSTINRNTFSFQGLDAPHCSNNMTQQDMPKMYSKFQLLNILTPNVPTASRC